MFKVAHIGDIHISGKHFDRAQEALEQASKIIIKEECNIVVLSGDVFDRYNIADRFKTVGEQQALLKNFIKSLLPKVGYILIANGNHDTIGKGKSALEFLEDAYKRVFVIQKQEFFSFQDVGIGVMPWICKSEFIKRHCVGKPKSEIDQMFSKYIEDMLGFYKAKIQKQRAKLDVPSILFGHCDIEGHQANDYYKVQGGSFAFSEKKLHDTGFDYVSLSHIHKRSGLYVGSLFQNNFGEEGNPQGFEIVTVEGQHLKSKYHHINLPEHTTIDIMEDSWLPDLSGGNYYKLRFYFEKSYNEFMNSVEGSTFFQDVMIERLWDVKKHVSRTDNPISPAMSLSDLLDEYMNLNPLPEGISKELIKGSL